MISRAQASVEADIIGQLDAAEPDNDEVDIAAATSTAVRKLRSEQVEERDNLLVYYGSGISTSGLIDMRTVPICDLDVETSAKELAEVMDIDLNGVKVIWYCCGDVAGTAQLPLSDNEKRIEKDFYRTWLTNMGADEVTFMDNVPLDGCYTFEHQVSVMETEERTDGLTAKVVPIEEVEESEKEEVIEKVFADGDILTFDDKSIAFLPDSTELAAPDVAMEALGYVISYMEDHPDFTLMVYGTTTSAGNLNEQAPLNRSVKLVDYNSAIAAEIIQSLNE